MDLYMSWACPLSAHGHGSIRPILQGLSGFIFILFNMILISNFIVKSFVTLLTITRKLVITYCLNQRHHFGILRNNEICIASYFTLAQIPANTFFFGERIPANTLFKEIRHFLRTTC